MSTHLVTFAAYNDGSLVPSLSPVWTRYVNAITGVPGTGPSVTALGTAGLYQVTVDDNYCGMLDLTAGADPRYYFVASYNAPAFGIIGDSGPITGGAASLTWDSLIDTATGLAPGTTPTFSDLGGGCYRPATWVATYSGVVDGGSIGADPAQLLLGPDYTASAGSAIIISAPTPASSTVIPASASITFSITDTNVSSFNGCNVEIVVQYPNATVELAYSTALGGFTPLYAPGSIAPPLSAPPNPGGFIVTRSAGWPANPTLTVSVSDTTGQYAEVTWFWQLAQAPISSVSTPPLPQATSPYGSDCRTSAPLADGSVGVDPYFLLVSAPNIVMSEAIARILLTPTGALWWAPSQGYNLRNLINLVTNGNFSGIQSAVSQAVGQDPRINSCTCLIQQVSQGTYSVNIQGIGGAGPFSCVFLLQGSGITALSFS